MEPICPSVRLAAVLASLALAGCAGMGDGALAVEEARDKPASETVRVQGPLVVQYGDAMICTELVDASPPQCEAGLWLRGPTGQLRALELETVGGIQWAASVTLEGTVDGNGFFVLAP
jgi:hypothetical protein